MDQDYRPIWRALDSKLSTKVAQLAQSLAGATQRLRFIRETITGSLNYTCGESPILPVGALGAVDLTFFRWVRRMLGQGRHVRGR